MLKPYSEEHEQQMRAFYTSLSERDKRRYAALAWIPTAAIDLRISPARQVVETLVDGLTPYG
jgi:hypothetical protein